jgi:phosphoglycerol transferase MdoB-like AlkP superfamily enzyme
LVFLAVNYSNFADESFQELLMACVHGVRFDLSALTYMALPFIVLHFIPRKENGGKWLNPLIKITFCLTMTGILLLNMGDIIYYQFTFKRATSDVFHLVATGGDFIRILPQLLFDYWYLLILLIFLGYLGWKVFDSIGSGNYHLAQRSVVRVVYIMAFFVLVVIAARGGIQLKPIGIINAGLYNSPNNIPLVLNTPFSLLTTLGKENLIQRQYYTDNELANIYSPVQRINGVIPDTAVTNVVVIILESFSSEYSGFFGKNKMSYTPFLDSLAGVSYAFKRCYANGKKSIEGVPAILAGLPTLMNNPFITSAYAGNDIRSIAWHLGRVGYSSSFVHGGSNGTMGFDAFTKASGFDAYYGRDEYGNDAHFDGKWGIYDEEFLGFFLSMLNKEPEPFFSCFMSLSSHHPYLIPERYKGKFSKGVLDIHESIGYADHALHQFFMDAKQTDWYKNTLFVITADHTGITKSPYYGNRVGMYDIPLLFHHGGNALSGISDNVTQQVDIMPTLLNYIGFPFEFVAFGTNSMEGGRGFSVSYLNDMYEIISGKFVLQFDGNNGHAMYDIASDSLLQEDVMMKFPDEASLLENKLKAYIQSYNNRMIANQLTVK